MKHIIANWLYAILGDDFCGNVSVPLDGRTFYYRPDAVVSLHNDAHEVWIGTKHEWETHFSRKDFHRMIGWYLYQWGICEWFGLRRVVWYWALSVRCSRHAQRSPDRGGV
jgi:hypothetical protein